MNHRSIFTFLFLAISFQTVLLGQTPTDSSSSLVSNPNVEDSGLFIRHNNYCLDIPHSGIVIDNKADFKAAQAGCDMFIVQPNFETHVLLACSYGGDCHMTVVGEVVVDDKAKTITLEATNYWGRCRAGGWRTLVVSIEKPKPGYKVLFHETQTDEPWQGEIGESD